MNPWVLRSELPQDMHTALVVFPYAGGGASVFRNWPGALAPDIGVVTIQPPGRENRLGEEPLRSYADMLPHLVGVVASINAPRLAFFGHSAGAHLSFATAQRLRAEGKRTPDHMLISGRRPLHLPGHGQRLSDLDDRTLTQTMMRISGQASLPSPELFEMMLPTTRADIAASEDWPIEDPEPMAATLSLLNGTRDGWTDADEILGWRELIRGKTNQRTFEGDHFFITEREDEVLAFIRGELNAGSGR